MSEEILYQRDGSVRRIVLNIPLRHNSLGESELEALHRILDELEGDSEARVLTVTGAGESTFCAGASLKDLGGGKISGDHFQSVTDRIAALPFPTLALLNGNVFGGGVELALSCDFRIGVSGSRMRVPAARIGLCYPISGIQRFVERLGASTAKRILVAAEEFDATGMVDIGFLDRLVDREQLVEAGEAYAGQIADLAPLAVKAMKGIINQAAAGTVDHQAAAIAAQQCLGSSDLQEGFAAQREKRSPSFRGV